MPTTYDKATLSTYFQTGDVPGGSDYENLIYSQVNVVETSTQSMNGALQPTELITARISAGNAVFTGTVRIDGQTSAQNINCDSISVSALSTNTFSTNTISTSSLTVTKDVSAAGTVYASAVRSTNGMISGVGIVSAAGTAQATAALLTNVVNHGRGVTDGSTTGFTPLTNRAGLVQYLFNEGPSANLWPPSGGFINGLAVNAPLALVASAMVTIVHLAASAYGVK